MMNVYAYTFITTVVANDEYLQSWWGVDFCDAKSAKIQTTVHNLRYNGRKGSKLNKTWN